MTGVWGAMDDFDFEREKGTGGGGGGRGIPPVDPAVSVVEDTTDERPCSFSEITIKSRHSEGVATMKDGFIPPSKEIFYEYLRMTISCGY